MKPLLLDLGNTRLKWTYLEERNASGAGRDLQVSAEVHVGSSLDSVLEKRWRELPRPSALYVANVAGEALGSALAAWVWNQWCLKPCFACSASHFGGLRNGYRQPDELGVDRWLAMIAAWKKYQAASCVLDLGSAVTLDLITADGRHLGGYILPGRRAAPAWLARHTGDEASLPPLPARITVEPGTGTAEAVAHGTAAAVLGVLRQALEVLREEAPRGQPESSPRLLLTGGDAADFLPACGPGAIHEPHLVLRGLAEMTS